MMPSFQFFESAENFKKQIGLGKAALTIGTFDGVHLGHQKILRRLIHKAEEKTLKATLLSFFPHPRKLLGKEHDIEYLSDPQEKISLLDQLGLEVLIQEKFNRKLANLSAEEYVDDFLKVKIGPRELVVGYDHRFGKDRKGKVEQLYAGFGRENVEVIEKEEVEAIAISSTKIRKALKAGDLNTAKKLLGYPYGLNGLVVCGDQRGREMGFPTANLQLNFPDKLIPAEGVYATRVEILGKYGKLESNALGMMNIGLRPTFAGQKATIEVHLFDFNADLYGKKLRLLPEEKIREEQKFNSKEELAKQLKTDENVVRQFFQSA